MVQFRYLTGSVLNKKEAWESKKITRFEKKRALAGESWYKMTKYFSYSSDGILVYCGIVGLACPLNGSNGSESSSTGAGINPKLAVGGA